MFKRFISGLGLAALVALLVPSFVYAGDVPTDFIQSIDLSVNSSSATSFSPLDGDILDVDVVFNTSAYESQLKSSTGYIYVKQGDKTVKTLREWESGYFSIDSLSWNGKDIDNTTAAQEVCGTLGDSCPNGDYSIEIHVEYESDASTMLTDTETKTFSITLAQSSLTVLNFGLNTTSLDPSLLGQDEDLVIDYTLNGQADSVTVEILNPDDVLFKTFISSTEDQKTSGSFSWDGKYANKLVEPGTFTARLTAVKSGEDSVTATENFDVVYASSDKPGIINFSVDPDSFDPDFEDAMIEFENTKDCDLTVEIREFDNDNVRRFDGYENDSFNTDDTHSVAWNGEDNSGYTVGLGDYRAIVIARSDYGVSVEEKTVTVDNSGGSLSSSNAHIDDISFSPSSTFEPAEDDEMEIEFDVKEDLDELTIYAVKGTTEIEIYNESDVEEDNNYEVIWEGTDDDDDYVDPGTWKILFKSKIDATELQAAKSIKVEYEKPGIDDLYVSKSKFDSDLGEFTNILFRVDTDANITIEILEDGSRDDTLIEDMEVEKDKWYAVEWDGGSYDYNDDLDIKLIAENIVMEDIYDTDKISIDLAEDDVSSSKSNVTGDYIAPVLTDGEEEMRLYYNLEDDADVEISIRKGTSSSGSIVIELVDLKNQDAGDHTIIWDGLNKSGNKLSKGVYNYKIISRESSSDTETGLFVVGNIGGLEGVSSDSSDTSDSNISSNVIVLDGDIVSMSSDAVGDKCAGFFDVPANSPYCEAINWAKDENIFVGYSDGTFKPYQAINRVEVLKVILEALNITIIPLDYTNLGFIDVEDSAWYMPYIRTGQFLGVFHGDAGESTARPAETVNRVEALKLIFEALRAVGAYQAAACSVVYADVPAGTWYYNYACAANQYSLFEGSFLNPSSLSTRGEVADMLYKLYEIGFF